MNGEHIGSKTLVAGPLSILLAAVVCAAGLDLARVEPGSSSPLFQRTERARFDLPDPGSPMGAAAGQQTPKDTPESLSGSVVTFHRFGADQTCVTPGAQHTICFRAVSPAAADREVESLWLRFPAGWTVAGVLLDAAPTCSGDGSFGGFSWVHGFLNNEVRIDHERIQAAGSECSATYCLDVAAGSWAPEFRVSWYWKGRPDTVPAPPPPHYPCSSDLYTPLGQPTCDEAVHPQARVGGWQQVAPMDVGVGMNVAAAWDGQVWSMANQNQWGNMNAVRRYDPVTDSWTLIPGSAMPTELGTSHSGCHFGEKVYLYETTPPPDPTGLWSYDMAANQWTPESPAGTPPDPAAILHPSWAFDPTSGLCFMTGGGDLYANGNLNTVFVYDPAANEWLEPLPGFDTPRDLHAAFVIDGKLCILGGHDGGEPEQALTSTQCFDFLTHSWNSENADIPPLPVAAGGMGFAAAADGNRLWIIGGAGNGPGYLPVGDTFFFDLDAGTWHAAGPPASGSLAVGGVAVLGNTVFHVGGRKHVVPGFWAETPIAGHYVGGPCGGPHPLSVVVEGEGSVERAPDVPGYYLGQQVQLTAVPAPGWELAGWSGDAGGTDNPIEVTVTGEMTVTATFIYPLAITSQSPLPDGFPGVEYLFAFSAAGGEPPYTWSVVAGALPPGLNLDADSGVLGGTPSDAGPSTFTVQVTDAANETAQGIFEIEVLNIPEPAVPWSERQALIALYESTNGAGWSTRTNWRLPDNSDFNNWGTECTWWGVSCNTVGTSVEKISLPYNNLVGTVPAALADLTNLRTLWFHINKLSGDLPPELGNLANLESLALSSNHFTGSIPTWLSELTNLQHLYLGGNQLTGGIPAWLGDLSSLKTLSLSVNPLGGGIPAELGNLGNLESLGLFSCELVGIIPPELGSLASLEVLYLSSNQLTGGVPAELGNLSNLEILQLSNNELSGAIPAELGSLGSLRELLLSNNQLSNAIPAELGNLVNLRELRLFNNQLSGGIPAEFSQLGNLEHLNLTSNQISGEIPPELAQLDNLKYISFFNNQLAGPVPAEFGGFGSLEILHLGENQLTGSIPPELGNLEHLKVLNLRNNQLSGTIPNSLGSLSKLQQLHLDNNQLSGAIPRELGSLVYLHLLDLNNNQFSGAIPPELGSLVRLNRLDLNNNQLSGSLPPQLGNLSRVIFLNLSNNQISGEIPPQFGNLGRQSSLDLSLSSNRLMGGIPSEVAKITYLRRLHLNGNQLTGEIPASLGNRSRLVDNDAENPSDLRWNGLYTSDPALAAFLDGKQVGGDWQGSQTIAPENVTVVGVTGTTATLTWTPILYTGDGGGYHVFLSHLPCGPYDLTDTVHNKTAGSMGLTGLAPGADYFAVVRTFTNPHDNNTNLVLSDPAPEVFWSTVSDGSFLLAAVLTGNGAGTVSSDPAGIDCGSACSASFPAGTVVTLAAEPHPGSLFEGWSGEGCSGTEACVVVMDRPRAVIATFVIDTEAMVPMGLAVDELPGGGATGNLNGILEPGETVAVAPSWHNPRTGGVAVTGLATGLTGPGSGYALVDAVADYGTIPAGGTANCGDATGNCYLVSLEVPVERPTLHWDLILVETLSTGEVKAWTIHVGDSFVDVGVDHWAYRFIETLLHSGITAGCGGFDYCPTATLTRWQMGVFLAKAMVGDEALLPDSGTVPGPHGGDYACGVGGVSVFADVSPEDPACRHIHYIAVEDVTVGCGGGNYCPAQEVTRWQMGVFLAKAMVGDEALLPDSGTVPDLGDYTCGAGGVSVFGDVLPTDPACRHIHYIAAEGVTAGCGGGNYCPGDDLSRAEMAVFLVKAFGLTLDQAPPSV